MSMQSCMKKLKEEMQVEVSTVSFAPLPPRSPLLAATPVTPSSPRGTDAGGLEQSNGMGSAAKVG